MVVMTRVENLGRRALGHLDLVGKRMFPNAQAAGAKMVYSRMLPTAPIPSALRPDQIKIVDVPTMFAMQQGSGATGLANSGAAIGSGPAPVAPEPGKGTKSRFFENPVFQRPAVKLALKVAGGGLIALGLPFAPVTPGGIFLFSLPLFAAGYGLIRLGMNRAVKAVKPAEPTDPPAPATRTRSKFMALERALPGPVRVSIYTGYAADILYLFTAPKQRLLAVALGLATGGLHFLARKVEAGNQKRAAEKAAFMKREEENRPLHQKIAQETSWVKLNRLLVELAEKRTPLPDDEILLNRMGTALHDKNNDLDEIARSGQLDADQAEARQNIAALLEKIDSLVPARS